MTPAHLAPAWMALAVLAVSPSGAQEKVKPQSTFGEVLDVRVVNVDVHVTDKKGNPLTDLTIDDFILLIDGKPVPISNFYQVKQGDRQPPVEPLLDAAPSTPNAVRPTAEAAGSEPQLIAFFLDNFQLRRADRRRILDDLAQFAESAAGEGVRFLVATGDPALHLRTSITRDLEEVRSALAAVADLGAWGDEASRQWRQTFSSIQSTYETCEAIRSCVPCIDVWEQLLSLWDLYSGAVLSRQSAASGALDDLLRAFEGLPGRKLVIYAASGLEQRPGIDLLRYLIDLCPNREREFFQNSTRYDHTKLLLDLGALANSARATLYAIDAQGLPAPAGSSVAFDFDLVGRDSAGSGSRTFRPSPHTDQLRVENSRGSMFVLADRTGGSAILNTNAPADALRQKAGRDLRHYYSLGYTRDLPPDGKTHQIAVKLENKRRGVRVRSRRAWLDKTLDERMFDQAISSLTFGEQSNALGVSASVGDLRTLESDVVEVPVRIDVSLGRLTLVEDTAGTTRGRFRVILAASAPNGDRTVLRQRFFDVTPDALAQGLQSIVVNMSLRPGEYTIGVSVRDEIGTEASYLTLPATVVAAVGTLTTLSQDRP